MASQLVKRIVCLAYSEMPGGRCVAGRELQGNSRPGGWIRPVSGHDGEGVSLSQTQYRDGVLPRLLDIMDVPVLRPEPSHHQAENWLIDPNRRWNRVDVLAPSFLPEWSESTFTLWTNGDSSTAGRNDRVILTVAKSLQGSLYFIQADLELRVFEHFNKRRVQGRFWHNDANYWLSVTDPDYKQAYLKRPNGTYHIGECYITVSLTGVYIDGKCYKVIAAIIKP